MEENLAEWSLEKLRRKAAQEWEMAGLARMDGDSKDAAKHTDKARIYDLEISNREENQ